LSLFFFKKKQLFKIINRSGTSLISLILSPKEQLPRMMTMLTDEQASATNIQDRVNRQSVIDALVTVRNRLKLYRKGIFF